MSEENKAVIRRVYDELWNRGNPAVADELFSPAYVRHAPFHPLRGPEGIKEAVRVIRAAFPDVHIAIEDLVAEGDRVVVRWATTGTHRGAFRDLAPTGKRVAVEGITISRLAEGKVAEEWVHWDTQSMMQQLGVLPAQGQTVQ
jgi:steroid delta-isomerase-like uncharacterized protein